MMSKLPGQAARCRVVAVASLICSLSIFARPSAAQDGDASPVTAAVHRQTLRQIDVNPTAAGAIEYLRSLQPSPERGQQVAALIEQLSDASFAKREQATRTLLRMPGLPIAQLNAAVENADPEVRWRASEILQLFESQSTQAIYASFKVISAEATEEPAAGAVAVILAALPHCGKAHVRWAALEALLASATVDDMPQLRATLANGPSSSRVAAASALCAVANADGRKSLYSLLDDRDDSVAMEVARSLANHGDRASLKTLVRLLNSEEAEVRVSAVVMLRGMTGRYMGFAAYVPADKRYAAAKKWNTWITSEGARAKLTLPVPRHTSARGDLGGNTLVTTGSKKQVKLLDPDGKEIWSYPLCSWSAEKLQNGNILIGSYDDNRIVEVDPQSSKVIWEYEDINCMSAKPLPSGNIIASDFRGNRVVEISRDKEIVWEHQTGQNCFDSDRLPNGNTIFGCPNFVREVTSEGKLIREWEIEGRLNGFQALPSGNILVANFTKGEVVELTPEGKQVWKFRVPTPCDVFRLPTGNTLISTQQRIIEIGPDKKLIREICSASYGSARM